MSDLISRQALRDAMYHEAFETDTEMQRWDSGCWIRYKLFENCIDSMPTIEPEPKKGEWIEMGTNKDGTHNIKCSKCGEGYKTRGHARSIATKAKYNFCPNCGARMVSEE